MFRKSDRFSKIGKSYKFSAAHHLPKTPDYHQCHRLHGHNYTVDVEVVGVVAENAGWVRDFEDLDHFMAPIIKELDHVCLNDVEGLENPTAENLAHWIMDRVRPNVYAIRVWETDKAFAEAYNFDGLWPKGFRF